MFLKTLAVLVLFVLQLGATSALITGPLYVAKPTLNGDVVEIDFKWSNTNKSIDLTGDLIRGLVRDHAIRQANQLCKRKTGCTGISSLQMIDQGGRFTVVIIHLKK